MQLLSSLIMLGGPSFLAAFGQQLLGAVAGYVGEVVERGMLLLLPPVDLLLVAAPQQAAPLLLQFMQVSAHCCSCSVSYLVFNGPELKVAVYKLMWLAVRMPVLLIHEGNNFSNSAPLLPLLLLAAGPPAAFSAYIRAVCFMPARCCCCCCCCCFLQRLLGLLLSGKESAVVVANSLALFARLLLQYPAAFEQLLGSAAAAGIRANNPQQQQHQAGGSSSPEELLLGLVAVWCDAFDSIAQPLARKLAACGLAALLGLPVKVR
jgi:hypothetical protein